MNRFIPLSIVLCWMINYSQGQNTIIILNDSVKIKTDLVSTSDDQLFTKAGILFAQ